MQIFTQLISQIFRVPGLGFALVLMLYGLSHAPQSHAGTAESVFMLSDDLASATKYYNHRGEGVGNYSYLFDRYFNEKQVMYARPKAFNWNNTEHRGVSYRQLNFPYTQSYAYLQRYADNKEFLEKLSDTRYRLTVDGSSCMDDGCRQEENIIAVVMPKRFKVLSYEATQYGQWKVVDSTYTFYASNVKGASVTIEFEDLFALIYNRIFTDMSVFKGIEVQNKGGQIQVVMPMDNVFSPGGTAIQGEGTDWVKRLGNTLREIPFQEVKVEGHADSIPVKVGSIYPSNWELSAARAAMALRLLIEQGVAADKLAAVGYGDSRPVGDNKTTKGRAKNRRISFSIVPRMPEQPI